MTGFNKVILMGRLTRDPQLTSLPSGTSACDVGLAVNRQWKDAQGQKREEVLFVDCNAFGKRAEALARYFHKGHPIHIEGRLKLDQWETEDGSHRTKFRVTIDQFGFVAPGTEATTPTAPATNRKTNHTGKRPASGGRRPAAVPPTQTAPAAEVAATATVNEEDIPF